MPDWTLRDASARLGELVRGAAAEPQTIVVRGRRAAVVLSAEQYDRLDRPKPSLAEFLRDSPLAGVELDIERDRSPPRDIEL